MQLPFSHEQFLEVFGAYNRALWPIASILWVATVGAFSALFAGVRDADRWASGILAAHWAWSGVAYHLAFFREINPAATLFGVLFMLEAGLILWRGSGTRTLDFETRSPRSLVGGVLVLYALAYPGLALLAGFTFPRLPSFGVPCPTAILTAGALILIPRRQAWPVAIIPLLWTAIGGSAAFLLGVRPDLVLPVAGLALLVHLVAPRAAAAAPES